jgi:uncharacterized membrane protein
MRFRQTLPAGERHLVGRIESFGDIVVGFSMSTLALQLQIPKTPGEIFAHPLNYFVFFIAFGLLAVFWPSGSVSRESVSLYLGDFLGWRRSAGF